MSISPTERSRVWPLGTPFAKPIPIRPKETTNYLFERSISSTSRPIPILGTRNLTPFSSSPEDASLSSTPEDDCAVFPITAMSLPITPIDAVLVNRSKEKSSIAYAKALRQQSTASPNQKENITPQNDRKERSSLKKPEASELQFTLEL